MKRIVVLKPNVSPCNGAGSEVRPECTVTTYAQEQKMPCPYDYELPKNLTD